MSSLQTRVFRDAVIFPTTRVESEPGKLLMGVFDSDGHYIAGSATDRTKGETGAPVDPALYAAPVDAEAGDAIFAGVIYNHFGHFLVESLARAWDFQSNPDATIVWAGGRDTKAPHDRPAYTSRLQTWQEDILRAMGITNPCLIVRYPTRFARVHIPDIGFRYSDHLDPEHAAFLGRYNGPPQVSGERLWLSRSRSGSAARDLSAEALERRLQSAGWRISFPEQMTVREQLDALAMAEVIAGEEGSAFHLLMLLKDVESKSIHMFRRHGKEHENMHTIGNARSLNQTFHTLERERVVSSVGREVSKLNPNAGEALDALGVIVEQLPSAGGRSEIDQTILHAIRALAPRRLLIVGKRDPLAFREIPGVRPAAVDPHHAGDPRAYAQAGIELFDLEVEDFVAHFHEEDFETVVVYGDDADGIVEAVGAVQTVSAPRGSWVLAGPGAAATRAADVLTGPASHMLKVDLGAGVVQVSPIAGKSTADSRDPRAANSTIAPKLTWRRLFGGRRKQP